MTNPTPLSPAAQAVLDAALQESNLSPTVRVTAAALRTAALYCKRDRLQLLTIAAELEGASA